MSASFLPVTVLPHCLIVSLWIASQTTHPDNHIDAITLERMRDQATSSDFPRCLATVRARRPHNGVSTALTCVAVVEPLVG